MHVLANPLVLSSDYGLLRAWHMGDAILSSSYMDVEEAYLYL